jgi:hypothetical protein
MQPKSLPRLLPKSLPRVMLHGVPSHRSIQSPVRLNVNLSEVLSGDIWTGSFGDKIRVSQHIGSI